MYSHMPIYLKTSGSDHLRGKSGAPTYSAIKRLRKGPPSAEEKSFHSISTGKTGARLALMSWLQAFSRHTSKVAKF